jgi:hypothetical protein
MAAAITSDLPDTASLAHLLPPSWKADIQRWFAEDTPSFDWAGYVVGEEEQEAILWGKSGVCHCSKRLHYAGSIRAGARGTEVAYTRFQIANCRLACHGRELTCRASWPECPSLTRSWHTLAARELPSQDAVGRIGCWISTDRQS